MYKKLMKIKKAVLLAGGFGTRISEESSIRPKPMVMIDDKPILWHIMKYYSYYGVNEFIICCGYKSEIIKEFFINYSLINSDFTIDLRTKSLKTHKKNTENWKVTLVDTGINTMTGGRIKKISNFIKKNENFFMTYGDGLTDIDLSKLEKFHFKNKTIATVSTVTPPSRWGNIEIKNNLVTKFTEKPISSENFINCGFFVLNYKIFKYIEGDNIFFEQEPMKKLTKDRQLSAYNHRGFFASMDTLKDKLTLQEYIQKNKAPWMKWL
jgi:glucose-1-phosphate cytidylyltransferase